VVLADHGSTDATPSIITGFQERFSQVRSVRVPTSGTSRAHVRNRAICESRGELLVFIDHDVLVPEGFLWGHVAAHEKFPSSIVAGAIFNITKTLEPDHSIELDHVSASYAALCANRQLSDDRLQSRHLPEDEELIDLRSVPAPFRFFWGGNLSAYRSDIDACGLFDETYRGWGMEDEDFAQQFRVRGRGLTFSRTAWGLHLPEQGEALSRSSDWRLNFDTFFRKFPTREIESYSLHTAGLIPLGMGRLDGLLPFFKSIDIRPAVQGAAEQLGAPVGRRLCHFVVSTGMAGTLQLTDALSPFGPPTETARHDGRTHWWPLFGFKTPFADKEIEELVLMGDVLAWLDRYTLTLILAEGARVAQRAIICCAPEADSRAGAPAIRALRDVVSTVNFGSISWIGDARH
jgi:glycosyl transferase family 2/glycosyl transferase family 7 (putative galactosyltransferase)